MDLSIIVPCYNEAQNIPKLVSELLPVADALTQSGSVEIVIVDDGSTDTTWEGLQEAFGSSSNGNVFVQLVRHTSNLGLGAALRTGFRFSRYEVIVTTDSDGTYPFEEIPALLAYLKLDVDLVTASPYHPLGGVAGVPGYRLFLSRSASLLYRLIVTRSVHTYTALFRAYRRSVVSTLTFHSNNFLAGTELLVNAYRSGFQVAEYPTVLHRREYGVSKAALLSTILSHLRYQSWLLVHPAPYIRQQDKTIYSYQFVYPSSQNQPGRENQQS